MAAKPSTALVNQSVTMTKVKETKNTVLYKTDDENAPVSTQYVNKSAFTGDSYPETILVSIGA